MLGSSPWKKPLAPCCFTISRTIAPTGAPLTVTRDRTVSMGCVRAVPAIEARDPPNALCHPCRSMSPDRCRHVSLNWSNTKNSTALVGAMRATFSELPLKSPKAPSLRTILRRVPRVPSLLASPELIMYSTLTRSSGATTERETPPEMAPTSRCLATDFRGRRATSPAIRVCLPLSSGKDTSTSPRSTAALPHTSKTSLRSLALDSMRKSRNSAKSTALPCAANAPGWLEAPRSPPPLEKGPSPVLMVRSIFATCALEMPRYPSCCIARRSCLSVMKP
mmetsp:Transcript_33065/g.92593  ORF Transcript_33065/g.92593 Transcript_33065/m.92593 type:complete len:278 (-) Transcript_33065:283-1116(-)